MRARPEAGDAMLAAGLACFAEAEVWLGDAYRGSTAINAILVLIMALSLARRRREPLVVLMVVMVGLTVQSVAFGSSEAGSLLLISLVSVYSAAAHSSQVVIAAGIGWAGALLHDLADPAIDGVGSALFSSIAFGLVFLFGLGMRYRQSRTSAAEHRAQLLMEERERDRLAAVEERQRIARELHDIVAHGLAVMVVQAGAAEQVLETSPRKARESLQAIRAAGQEAVGEMARLLELIRDESPSAREPHPTLADLEQLVRKTSESGLAVALDVEGRRRTLPAALELSAFRIVQEALTNVLKHADAKHARVVVRYREHQLELEVADDGALTTGGGRGGYGLAGLRERVAIFDGRIDAGRGEDGGWTLHAVLPVAQ
jgi:signal transduction histidine kinase